MIFTVAVCEIREYGKYLYNEDREKRQRYGSNFLRKRRRQMLKTAKERLEQEKEKTPVVLELPVKSVN